MGFCMLAIPVPAAGEAAASRTLLKGGDISMLSKFEELGSVYRDQGNPADAIGIMMRNGCNCFRLRLFVNPTMKNAVIQDLDYVVKLAQRVKKVGGLVLLDIHYSDTWADPGHQSKPSAWRNLSFQDLESTVESYTTSVITTMKRSGCLPDIVQVGNEITPGFLWPEGQLRADEGGWKHFTMLLKAGIRGVKKPLGAEDDVKVMIHIDRGGSASGARWFFGKVNKYNVQYDMIGLSYYPWWHGSIDDLRTCLKQTAEQFGKQIMVVETAYPWRKGGETRNMDWPQTPQGQKQFLDDVIESVKSTPEGLGKGVLWWYPESMPNRGLNVWKDGRMALFDREGDGLPALEAFRTERRADKALEDTGVPPPQR